MASDTVTVTVDTEHKQGITGDRMMNQKGAFRQYLQKRGFKISQVLASIQLVPHFYKDGYGNHILLSGIGCCIFDGSNTKRGNLGCVTLFYSGTCRPKYRCEAFSEEILKIAFCPKSAQGAIQKYDSWIKASTKSIAQWKLIQ